MEETNKLILEHLQKGVLDAKPGSQESVNAVRALDDFKKTNADLENRAVEVGLEVERTHTELRLKQDESDDRTVATRDEAILKQEENKARSFREWVEIGLKAFGVIINAILCIIIIRKDADGKPILSGPGRQIVSNLFRK